ncbi:MAG: NAD(P)-dependent oxidoreductase [Candidatus Omnitrophota bacterium]
MCYEVFAEEEAALKRYLPKEIQAGFSAKTVQLETLPQPPARLISIRTQSLIPSGWYGGLSGILTRSSGYDHLSPVWKGSQGKIACGYLPSYCAHAVAEHALLVLLALSRKLKKQSAQFTAFSRDGITGAECLGRKLLVVGVGRIGKEMAALARGIGMEVKGVDLVTKVPDLEYVSLEEGIRDSDAMVCALPLTRLTRGLLDYSRLKTARAGLLFVNISRGEISPIRDLKRLLEEEILGGIGLDVYEEENILGDSLRTKKGSLTESGKMILSLQGDDRVIFTPHNAFNTRQALERKARQSCESVVAFLKNGSFPDPIPEEE